ncbi:MAG: 2-C-methyl-D-erythritol 4-phosphate cytidylyltransferase [Oscillospiraceae bacterium]|jgi:2-C-methyl-D-erythritol 4-phosphate cytidylyltransferase|nr:2-C-methyl-D-erythritol 4-phosphate cytidylyltransferase [Oscillospiraceae bacterium]
MIYAAILAGGKGTRFGSDTPKQFLKLGRETILQLSAKQFIEHEGIGSVYIAVPEQYLDQTRAVFKQKKVTVISGGNSRNASLKNIVEHITASGKILVSDIILTHDAARPFVTRRIIDDNITALDHYDGAGTAIPVTDTIYDTYNDTVAYVRNRDLMQAAQTPQSFNLKKLSAALSVSGRELAEYTDTCGLFLKGGINYVKAVKGDPTNIKITTPIDYDLAKVIYKGLKNAP